MGIFGSIKDAIFGHPAVTAAPQSAPAPQAAPPSQPAQAPASSPGTPPAASSGAPQPKIVDPEAALEKIAAQKGNPDLNWRTSIVDLMKLIGMDPSLANRQELATELGYTGDKNGSAEMNMWLHDQVMERIRTGK